MVAVIGGTPKDNVQGASEADASAHADYQPDGAIGQSVTERREELEDEGFEVHVMFFSSLTDYLCWLCRQISNPGPGGTPQYAHVELYGHGNAAGPYVDGSPHTGWSVVGNPALTPPQVTARWNALGKALHKVMAHQNVSGELKGGHIVLFWCGAAAANWGLPGTEGEVPPAALVASSSGVPVYTPKQKGWAPCQLDENDVPKQGHGENYPAPSGFGEPFGQPQPNPEDCEPKDPFEPGKEGDSGWRKWPPSTSPMPGAKGALVTPANAEVADLPASSGAYDPIEGEDPDAGDVKEEDEDDVPPATDASSETHEARSVEGNPCDDEDVQPELDCPP